MAASMSDDRDAHHGMSGWDYAAEAQKMTGDFEAFVPEARGKLTGVRSAFVTSFGNLGTNLDNVAQHMLDGLDNLEDQSNSLREELSAQSQILMEPASEYLADLTEKMTEAQEVEGGVIESIDELRKDIEDKRADDIWSIEQDYNGELNDAEAGILNKKEEYLSMVHEIYNDYSGENADINEEMDKELESDQEAGEELDTEMEEITKEERGQRKGIRSTGRKLGRQFQKIGKSAVKLEDKAIRQEQKNQGIAAKQLKFMFREVLRELKDHAKEWKDKAKEVKQNEREKVASLKEKAKDIRSEIMETAGDLRKDDMEAKGETMQTFTEASNTRNDAVKGIDDYALLAEQLLRGSEDERENIARNGADQTAKFRLNMDKKLELVLQNLEKRVDGLGRESRASSTLHSQETTAKIDAAVDEFKEKSASGFGDLEKATTALVAGAEQLSLETEGGTAEVNSVDERLGSVAQKLEVSKRAVVEQFGKVAAATLGALKEVKSSIEGKIPDMTDQITKHVQMTDENMVSVANSAATDVLRKITELQGDSDSQLERSARTISTAIQKGESILQKMNITAASIQDLKGEIVAELPEAKTKALSSIQQMRTELEMTEEALESSIEVATASIHAHESEQKSLAGGLLGRAREDLQTKYDTVTAKLDEALSQIQKTVAQQDTLSQEDYEKTVDFATRAAASVDDGRNRVVAGAQQSASDVARLVAEIGKVKNMMQVMTGAQETNSAALLTFLGNQLSQTMIDEKETSDEKTEAARVATKESLDTAVLAGETSLRGENTRAQQALGAMNEKAAALDSTLEGLTNKVGEGKANALKKTGELSNTVRELKNVVAGMDETTAAVEGEEIEENNKKRDEFKRMAEGLTGVMENEVQKQDITQFAGIDSTMEEVQRELDENQEQVAQSTNDFTDRVAKRAGSVKTDDDQVFKDLQQFAAANRAAEADLQKETDGVKANLTLGEDKVTADKEQAQRRLSDEAKGLTQGLSTSVSALKEVGAAGEVQRGEIQENLRTQFQKVKSRGNKVAKELEMETNEILASMPNFAEEFGNNTFDNKDQLKKAEDSMVKTQNWTETLMKTYFKGMDQIRVTRENAAIALHTKTSGIKTKVVGEAEKAVKKLLELKRLRETRFLRGMREEIKDFQKNFVKLGSLDVDHDQGQIERMQGVVFALQTSHKRLMDWYSREQQMRKVWRAEVERQLEALGRGISKDDEMGKAERLDEEAALAVVLRDLQKGIREKMVHGNLESTRAFSSLSTEFQNGFRKLQDKLRADEEARKEADKTVEEALARKKDLLNKNLAELRTHGDHLSEEATRLERASNSAQSHMEKLRLPLKNTEPANLEAHDRYRTLMGNITHQLGNTPASLLEEGVALTKTTSESALARVVAAVTSLNDEFYRQNAKLQNQNRQLKNEISEADTLP